MGQRLTAEELNELRGRRSSAADARRVLASSGASGLTMSGFGKKHGQGRGVCCSCNARRAHDTAIHVAQRVLPRTPYRQWTLSFPIQLRYLLARDSALLSEVLSVFMRALFNFQRKTARRLGVKQPRVGALAFLQRFGSALQLTPHFHVLLPEAVFEEVSGSEASVRVCLLPGPDDEEVDTLLRTVAVGGHPDPQKSGSTERRPAARC